jgi:hypothetical protein
VPFSIYRFFAALAALASAIPLAVEQLRKDPAAFWRAQRLAGLYFAWCAVAIAIMLFLATSRENPSEGGGAIILFVGLWVSYGAIWLGRLLPRNADGETQLPSWLDRRPSWIDCGMIAAIAAAFLWALP